ncbi:MAG: competence protein ComEC family protein [Anaerolineae bacterium]|nr:competence protein ComEC family protein [Anaerolineae bacterium]
MRLDNTDGYDGSGFGGITLHRAAPFVIIGVAFSVGIWAAQAFELHLWLWAMLAVAGLIGLILTRRDALAAWVCASLMLLGLGAVRYGLSQALLWQSPTTAFNGKFVVLEGMVIDEPDVRLDDIRLRVRPSKLIVDSASATPSSQSDFSNYVLIRADKSIPWRYGDTLRARGALDAPPVLSEFDYRDYLARQEVLSWMSRPQSLTRLDSERGSALWTRLLHVKDLLRQSIRRIMPAPESALLNGILIGDDNEMPDTLVQAFRTTGTSHIVAISGFNVSIVIALVVPVLSQLLNKRRAALVAIPAIIGYVLLVGASASVVRAGAMSIIALIGQALWRRGFTINTLAAAAFFMLMWDPDTLFDGGFQLSVMATLGLVLYADLFQTAVQTRLEQRFSSETARKITNILADMLLITFAAQLTTLPLILMNFHNLSLVALFTNALVLPAQPPIMILGGLAALSGMASEAAGWLLGWPPYVLLTYTLRVVEWTAGWPLAAVPIYNFGAGSAALYYAVLFSATTLFTQSAKTQRQFWRWLRQRALPVTAMIALITAIGVGVVWQWQKPDGKLRVILTGSAAFIQTPSGKQVVFVGGGGLAAEMGRAMPIWDRAVELVILPSRDDFTRADALSVLNRYRVGTLAQPVPPASGEANSPRLAEFQAAAANSVVRMLDAPLGTRVTLEPDVTLTLVERGDNSLGAKIQHGEVEIELAGDTDILAGSDLASDLIFANPRTRNIASILNPAAPLWVIWADAPGSLPTTLSARTRVISLRDSPVATFVSDGKQLRLE